MSRILTSSLIGFLFFSNYLFGQKIGCQSLKIGSTAVAPIYSSPENLRSDTINVLKYTINLDITDFVGQKISGNTIVKFAPKINGQNKLRLDLLKMTIVK